MTARRRYTTSETGWDPSDSGVTASILNASQPSETALLIPNTQTPLWTTTQSDVVGLYKKTDVLVTPNLQNIPPFPQTNTGSSSTSIAHYKNSDSKTSAQSFFHYNINVNRWVSTGPKESYSSLNSSNLDYSSVQWKSDVEELSNMASRDRTQEFGRIIRSQQGNLVNGSVPFKDTKKPKDFRQYTEFMQRAKLIGRNISSTYAKLEKLTHLAKKRSLFDDSKDHEIQELTGIIRHDLTSLTKQLEDLQSRSKLAGSGLNGTSGHLQKHSANLVGSLQTKVATITRKFKDVLEVRTESLKKQAERREQYAGGMVSGELPPQAVAGHHQGSVLLADEMAAASATRNRHQGAADDISIDMGSEGASGGSLALEGASGGTVYQRQLQLMEEQDAYLQSRADTMKTIESTIVELGQMFTQLATMVKEQEEIVHRIDSNVDEVEMNVEAAHTELLKYFKSVSSNRWLMLKIFGVLIFFFVVFVVFMA